MVQLLAAFEENPSSRPSCTCAHGCAKGSWLHGSVCHGSWAGSGAHRGRHTDKPLRFGPLHRSSPCRKCWVPSAGTAEVKPQGLQNALGSAHSRHCTREGSDSHGTSPAPAAGQTTHAQSPHGNTRANRGAAARSHCSRGCCRAGARSHSSWSAARPVAPGAAAALGSTGAPAPTAATQDRDQRDAWATRADPGANPPCHAGCCVLTVNPACKPSAQRVSQQPGVQTVSPV